jgi:hypothetical protein
MERSLVGVLALLFSGAQSSPPADPIAQQNQIVDARQPEVARLGDLFYRVNLDGPQWTRKPLTPCAAWTHHAFALFSAKDPATQGSPFLAVYSLDHPKAKSLDRPWEGGVILVRLDNLGRGQPAIDESTQVTLFNRILAEERAKATSSTPQIDPQTIASCYLRMTGEKQKENITADPKRFAGYRVDSMLIPVQAAPATTRTQFLRFDNTGLVEATIFTRPSE